MPTFFTADPGKSHMKIFAIQLFIDHGHNILVWLLESYNQTEAFSTPNRLQGRRDGGRPKYAIPAAAWVQRSSTEGRPFRRGRAGFLFGKDNNAETPE